MCVSTYIIRMYYATTITSHASPAFFNVSQRLNLLTLLRILWLT